MTGPKTCSITLCDKPVNARGWCAMHYYRWVRSGSPHVATPAEMLWRDMVRTDGGCWLWIARRDRNGYGRRGHAWAHRLSYELLVGPIPDGLELDHLCRNPACVNPSHLEPVTHAENMRRSWEILRPPACPMGHPFTEENTYRRPTSPGRVCRTCTRERWGGKRRQQEATR